MCEFVMSFNEKCVEDNIKTGLSQGQHDLSITLSSEHSPVIPKSDNISHKYLTTLLYMHCVGNISSLCLFIMSELIE